MKAKVTCIYDEGSLEGTHLIGARGFSVLIEADDTKTLFDTGMRGRYLLHNLSHLDQKLGDIDRVVISHGHKSHVGGLRDFVFTRDGAIDVYLPSSALGKKKLLMSKGVIISPEIEDKAKVREIDGWTEISGHVSISPPMNIGDGLTESFIMIETRKGPAVVSACSHCGADKIMQAVKDRTGKYPKAYIGGLHIGKKEQAKADKAAADFSNAGCDDLYLNHCTGVKGMMQLRVNLGLGGVSDFYVGSTAEFDI